MPYQYSTTPLFVSEGDTLKFKYKAPSFWAYTETVTVQIGSLVVYWLITTVPEDFQPDPFPLQGVINAPLDTMYTYGDGLRAGEQIITVSGLTPTTQALVTLTANFVATVADYAVRINGGAWILPAPNTTVQNGDTVQIRMKSAPIFVQPRELTLGIGFGYEVWRIETTSVPRNAPNPFPQFNDLTNQPINKNIYSNVIRIQGLLRPAIVGVDNGAVIGISDSNATTINAEGFDVLSAPISGANFTTSSATVSNGQYLQLKLGSSTFATTPKITSISIGDTVAGSAWQVTTGLSVSTSPNSFSFTDVSNAIDNFLIASDTKPTLGITGLGTNISVPVILESTTSSEVKIKINDGSIGVFPANVTNGDKITLYAKSSATFSATVSVTIKIGGLSIPTWQVVTNSGPDTTASFNVPAPRSNQVPNTAISSEAITVTGINRPVSITATNGALISINFDTPNISPRTFDPTIHNSVFLVLTTPAGLGATANTIVTIGTGIANNPFTWSVSTYSVAPPPSSFLSTWYSKKNENRITNTTKYDGYPIGTVLPILKKSVGDYGALDGSLSSRFPGYLVCNGVLHDAAKYPELFNVIGNTYGGTATYDTTTKVYAGQFKVPDYRNRRICGVGIVDGNKPSSVFLPVSGGGSVTQVGQEGGWWYVDKVDAFGPLPYEQATGDLTSDFFTLGIVKTTGAELITSDITFTMNPAGALNGTVGPVVDKIVNPPPHTHFYISAVVESADGDPVIPWDKRALFATNVYQGRFPETLASNQSAAANITFYKRLFTWTPSFVDPRLFGQPEYISEVDVASEMVNAGTTLTAFISDMGSAGTRTGGPFGVYWPSPSSNLVNDTLVNQAGDIDNGAVTYAACIDTKEGTFRIDTSTTLSGITQPHSHFITMDPVTNPAADYTSGEQSGAGNEKRGLLLAQNSLNLTFTQPQVLMDLTEGKFTFNKSVKNPIPEVKLSPTKQVPVITQFHKVRYMIKAY